MKEEIAGMELGLPEWRLIIPVSKAEECLIPAGGAVLDPGDQLLIFADKKDIPRIRSLIEFGECCRERDPSGAEREAWGHSPWRYNFFWKTPGAAGEGRRGRIKGP